MKKKKKNSVFGWMQQTFKNGRPGATRISRTGNILRATFTNRGISWVPNPGGYGYTVQTPPQPNTYYSYMDGKTVVNITMGIDGDTHIEVTRDGQVIYDVEIAPEHLSVLERDMPTVNVKTQP